MKTKTIVASNLILGHKLVRYNLFNEGYTLKVIAISRGPMILISYQNDEGEIREAYLFEDQEIEIME